MLTWVIKVRDSENLKAHLKSHFSIKVHVENWESWKKTENEKKKIESSCQEVGLRIGRLCYDIYKDGSS